MIKKIMQDRFGEKNGNCVAAVYATLLGCDIREMGEYNARYSAEWQLPNEYDEKVQAQARREFLKSKGFQELKYNYSEELFESLRQEEYKDVFVIVSGKSPRGDFDHCVIYKGGKMYHDPHPDNAGLEDFKFVSFLVIADGFGDKVLTQGETDASLE